MAREYYSCSDLVGVFVEEASRYVCMYVSTCLYMSYIYMLNIISIKPSLLLSSSHWEARILLPDVMANRIYPYVND